MRARADGTSRHVDDKTQYLAWVMSPPALNFFEMATLFVNDIKVADFSGQPPSGDNMIGLAAESDMVGMA